MYLSICLYIHLSICLSFYLSVFLSFLIFLPIYLSVYLPISLSLSISSSMSIMSIFVSASISIFLHLSIYRSVYLTEMKHFCDVSQFLKLTKSKTKRDFLNFRSWQHQKRSKSARLLQFVNLTTSRTKQFCETSWTLEVDNITNEAILRDFFQTWKAECRADGLVPMRCAIFPLHLSIYSIARVTKKWSQVIRSAAPVTQSRLKANLKI